MKLVSALLISLFLSACAVEVGDEPAIDPDATTDEVVTPTVEQLFATAAMEVIERAGGETPGKSAATATPITYHGGPIMLGTTKVYVIWYGNWTGNTALTIVPAFLQALGGSPYFNINTSYSNAAGARVSNALGFGGQTTDAYSRGKALGDNDVAMVIATALAAKKLSRDASGIYVVLSSADVNETSGMCTRYCGWHTYGTLNGALTRVAYLGNPDRCPTSCEAQTGKSPNANPGADGLVSVLAHELDESVTDPNLNAWFDAQGAENADKCAWTFGTTHSVANGSRANVKLAGKDYLIQQNWMNVGAGSCALAH
jgi:hypothetical protein